MYIMNWKPASSQIDRRCILVVNFMLEQMSNMFCPVLTYLRN